MANTKLQHFVNRAIPSNIRDEHPQFVSFVEKYFEYISRDLGEYDVPSNLLDYLNVDTTVSEFYDEFKTLYAPLLPEKYKASLSIIVKNVIDFYQTKGTEDSFTTFFRMIFDVTVDLYYPKVDMLRVSDGRWTEPYYLYPTDQTFDNQNYFHDQLIKGVTSGATAYVQSIKQIIDPDDSNSTIYVLSLVDRVGVFLSSEDITVEGEVSPTLTLDAADPFIEGAGFWKDTEGFISWNKYIQDSDYYQDYSYELSSSLSTEIFEKPVRDNLHPAGLKLFAVVTEGLTVIDIGAGLSAFIDDIVSWIETLPVEQTINSVDHVLSAIVPAPKNSGGNDFDWKHFEKYKDDTAFRQMYNLAALGSLPISHVSDNYSENFLSVTVGGVSAGFSIINGVATLDTPLVADALVVFTTTDENIPVNSRVYTYSGQTGEAIFTLPTIINRMMIGAVVPPIILNV